MAKSQIVPFYITAWNTPTTIITGGASGTNIDQIIINNSSSVSSGAITTKVSVSIVPSAGAASASNEILSSKSIFRQKNYEMKELEGMFIAVGTKLVVTAIPSVAGATALPSLVIAGSYENL
jgi:hypothetical protein